AAAVVVRVVRVAAGEAVHRGVGDVTDNAVVAAADVPAAVADRRRDRRIHDEPGAVEVGVAGGDAAMRRRERESGSGALGASSDRGAAAAGDRRVLASAGGVAAVGGAGIAVVARDGAAGAHAGDADVVAGADAGVVADGAVGGG